MVISAILHGEAQSGAPMLGDHLAMDLLNTEAREDGKAIEFWNSDDDVLQWLARYDVTPVSATGSFTPAELLTKAKALRTLARKLITEFKEGELQDINELNQYLHTFDTAPSLTRNAEGKLSLNCWWKVTLHWSNNANIRTVFCGSTTEPKPTNAVGAVWPYVATGIKLRSLGKEVAAKARWFYQV